MMKHEVVGNAPGFARPAPVATMSAARRLQKDCLRVISHLDQSPDALRACDGLRVECTFQVQCSKSQRDRKRPPCEEAALEQFVRDSIRHAFSQVEIALVFPREAYPLCVATASPILGTTPLRDRWLKHVLLTARHFRVFTGDDHVKYTIEQYKGRVGRPLVFCC
jgi:hypothetical protein